MDEFVFLTRLFVSVVAAWPVVVVTLVYVARRSRISRPGMYFLKSTAAAYAITLLGPVAIVVVFLAFGMAAEVATIYTILFGIPIFAVLPVVVALRTSRGRPAAA